MQEIARVILENEMDLILAHRRAMKLAELAGLSLSQQTTFATAVSEVSRNAIDPGKKSSLSLAVETDGRQEKFIVARLHNDQGVPESDGLIYAKRLVNKYNVAAKSGIIELFFAIHPQFKIDAEVLDGWKYFFRNELPLSPYEELKRKNDLLQDLSEKIQQSEAKYKGLTNSLPLIIVSLDLQGSVVFANEWLGAYSGETIETLNATQWRSLVHAEDYPTFLSLLTNDEAQSVTAVKTQMRLKSHDGEYLWHHVSLQPTTDEQLQVNGWNGIFVDIHAQKVYEETLKDNLELKEAQKQLQANQQILEKYIEELNRSNSELQQFAYIASHDLQEPIRKMLFYSDYLRQRYADSLDDKGQAYVENIHHSSVRMRDLINDILFFAQVNKEQFELSATNLNEVLQEAMDNLELTIRKKKAVISSGTLPVINGDKRMLRQVFENILGNSLKYAKDDKEPEISITVATGNGFHEIAIADNGIGFDEKYLPKMFSLFQRLHGRETFEGTGLGLAICKKIIDIHGGKITARGREGAGATFFVSLPA